VGSGASRVRRWSERDCPGFHNAEEVSLNRVWRNVEYPILQRNGVGMNLHTVGEGW
jgi:hypothetical protein